MGIFTRMPQTLEKLVAKIEPAIFRTALGLPALVQRRLAGPPVVVDGQTLDPETQWMLRLQKLVGEPAAETLPARRCCVRPRWSVAGSRSVRPRT
jgi:acetyl esterase